MNRGANAVVVQIVGTVVPALAARGWSSVGIRRQCPARSNKTARWVKPGENPSPNRAMDLGSSAPRNERDTVMTTIADHDAYIAAAPEAFRPSLKSLRALL